MDQPVCDALEQEVDPAYLTDLVQKALDRPGLHIQNWQANPLHGGVEWNSAVYRLRGEAIDGGEVIPWSLILKSIRGTPKSNDPGGIWYWKREALAYPSGMLHRLPGGLVTAPACYDTLERPDGSAWLWLEDVRDDIGSPWPVEQYALAARHLGRFNGAYLAGQALPTEAWLTHDWLRKYVDHAAEWIEFMRKGPRHPVVRRMFPGNTLAQVLAVWDERERILALLDDLPQVLCHQDAIKRNLFACGGRTVAIDWSYMGVAPVGAELVALVAGSLGFFEIPASQVGQMDRLCFESYLQGLREAGWTGDSRLVRTGFAVSLLLRYPIGGQVGEMLPRFLDQAERARLETAFEDKSAAELEQSDPAIVAYYESILPEALKLLGMVKLLRIIGRIGIYTLKLSPGKK